MIRYEIKFEASHSGVIKHVLRACGQHQAKAKITAAYPGQRLQFIEVTRLNG